MIKPRPVLLIILGVLLITGCNFFIDDTESTPDERMEAFIRDANAGNWGIMWIHFHPDADDYSDISNVAQSTFGGHLPLEALYVSGKTATCRSGTDPDTQFLFTVIEYDKDNYKIRYVEQTSTVIRRAQ